MSCMCIQHLQTIAAGLKNLPIGILSKLVADQLGPLNQAAKLAPTLCASLNAIASANMSAMATASASASATAAANLSANLQLSAQAMASLDAMAAVNRGLGLGALSPSVAARLRVMIQSVNLQAPDMLAALNEFLEPISDALDKLQSLAASLQGIQSLSGMNLAIPKLPFPAMNASAMAAAQARVTAMATAQASVSASASMQASAIAAAQANLAFRLQAASMALGFTLPGQAASLNAALALTAGLPSIQLPTNLLQSVCKKLGALAATMSALGVNLLAPNGMDLLAMALQTVQGNLQAMASANLVAMATANLSAGAQVAAAATAKLNASAILEAAAKLNLAIPNLQPLASSLSLAADLRMITGANTFASRPCSSCKIF